MQRPAKQKVTPYARKFIAVWRGVHRRGGSIGDVARKLKQKKTTVRAFAAEARRMGQDVPTFKTGPKARRRSK